MSNVCTIIAGMLMYCGNSNTPVAEFIPPLQQQQDYGRTQAWIELETRRSYQDDQINQRYSIPGASNTWAERCILPNGQIRSMCMFGR